MRYGGVSLDAATRAVLDEVKACDGDGGFIAVDREGRIAMPYNSHGMKRACASSSREPIVGVFDDEASG